MNELRFRQVHLDFHTSPLIPGIGEDFDPEEFAHTLKKAHVDSVTCFAKCHHGMSYYPTKVGVQHPNLKFDLLGEQIRACHKQGINVPVYTTVVWDEAQALAHADWRQVERNGRLVGRGPLDVSERWLWLCMNTPYVDHLAKHTREFVEQYDLDGVFFDIVMQTYPGCCCNYCLHDMAEQGINPENDRALYQYSLDIARRFMRRMSALVWSIKPGLNVFYNSRLRLDDTPERGNRPELEWFTHVEIESLPSGKWGYNHLPMYSRFFQTIDKPMMGMTAAFHKSWADFGTVKNVASLEYECFRALAAGAVCSVGDQLHPRGRLEEATYATIGTVYESVEKKEPWCRGATSQAEIGVLLTTSEYGQKGLGGRTAEEGAMRMLLETHQQFHVLDRASDLSQYRVIIAPDHVPFDCVMAQKVQAYLSQGGALIATHESGLTTDSGAFALDEFGVEYNGLSHYAPEFISVTTSFDIELAKLDWVCYEAGSSVTARAGTEVLARVVEPYFNRTWQHYSSHAQTPPKREESEFAALTRNGNVMYSPFPLFSAYRIHGTRAYRDIVLRCLELLLPQPLVRTDAPTTAEVTAPKQGANTVVHLLHYVPQRRTDDIDVIEDVIPLHDVKVSLRAEARPKAVTLVPQKQSLEFTWENGYAKVIVPEVWGHQMVLFEQA